MDLCRPEAKASGISECIVDISILLLPVLFISAVLPCTLIKWWRIRGDHRNKRLWVRYPGHTALWLITLALIYFQILEFSEGIISGFSYSDKVYLQLHLPPLVSILCSILSLLYFDFGETYNLPRLMLISSGYWIIAFVLKILKLSAMHQNDVGFDRAVVFLTWISTTLTLVLILIEVYSLRSQVIHIDY